MVLDLSRMCANTEDKMTISIKSIGRKRYPVLVIDNFYQDPEYVKRVTLSLSYYKSEIKYHSNKLSFSNNPPPPIAQIGADLSAISDLFYRKWASHYVNTLEKFLMSVEQTSFFSTIEASENSSKQSTHQAHDVAVFLMGIACPSPHTQGKIEFYRHKETGVEELINLPLLGMLGNDNSPVDADIILNACDMGVYNTFYELLEKGIVKDYPDLIDKVYGNSKKQNPACENVEEAWKCYDFIELKPNRFIGFPGFLIHSLKVNKLIEETISPFENAYQIFLYPWTPSYSKIAWV